MIFRMYIEGDPRMILDPLVFGFADADTDADVVTAISRKMTNVPLTRKLLVLEL